VGRLIRQPGLITRPKASPHTDLDVAQRSRTLLES
jgi:hypothetical protein